MRRVPRFGLRLTALVIGAVLVAGTAPASEAAVLAPACCDMHGSISLINTRTDQVIATVRVAGTPDDLIVSPTGESAYLQVLTKNSARIYKITSGPAASARPIAVRFSPQSWTIGPSGRYLYLGRTSRLGRGGRQIPASILPVATRSGRPERQITIPSSFPQPNGLMAASPNGRVLYYSTVIPDGVVPVTLATRHVGRLIRVSPASFQPDQMLFSHDSRRLYVLGENGSRSRLTEINVVTRRVVGSVSIRGIPDDMAITPGGGEVYVTSDRGTVTVVRTARIAVIKRISVAFAGAVAVAPNGRTAYVTGAAYQTDGAGQLTAISTRANVAAAPITVGPDEANGFAISPSGRWAYIFDFNDTVVPVNLVTNALGAPIPVASQPPEGGYSGFGGVGITPDGRLVYVVDLTT
jgi:DNA-binding beta-propeller fold protein YncE